MTDTHKPLPPREKNGKVFREDEQPAEPFERPSTDGPLPGLPPTTDPLLQPYPRPANRQVPND